MIENKWSEYLRAVELAKDAAVTFGLDSEQYKDAIINMEIEFLLVPKTKLEKAQIWLLKKR
jgi:hypothetical protein